ncbi:hypothetical protein M5E06_21070 [Azospirillum sp. A1-3]|uniref:hypothetical protein n=1 Tax=Azospirillum sp. A1-3 TaxID=185874 RepID=UPI002076EAD5|nr:hypothetical protein [Azospirillum sp. A1-3]MCM8736622.1 hypothetical protein [Azospirillum sp. A1-3]
MEQRVAKLETDVGEIKATLGALAPKIHEMHAFIQAKLPDLATKGDLSAGEVRLSDKVSAVAVEIAKRPTRADTWAAIGVIAAIASLPYWPTWLEGVKAIFSR